jgi:hypothetical protein
VANFAGNEFYFDYVSIGSPPPTEENSTCVLDVSNDLPFALTGLKAYPNPLAAGQPLTLDFAAETRGELQISLLDLSGKTLCQQRQAYRSGSQQIELLLPELPGGLYLLRLTHNEGQQTLKLRIE